jgi:HK97 family phage major capsid protein
MSDVLTVSAYVEQARAAIAAGKLDEAETLTKQAQAVKALAALEPTVDPNARLPFGTPEPETPKETATDIATKSWFASRYGDSGTAMDQVMTELYGQDHRKFAWAKSADFVRYVRSGRCDEKLHRALVYSPTQVEEFLKLGMGVSELKATQIESQDTLGGFLVPEDFRDRMIQRMVGLVAMRQMAETMTTTSDRVTMPVSTGGDDQYSGAVRWTKVDESPAGGEAATNATYGSITIPVHTIMGHVAVSKNLLEDTQGALSILPYLERQFADSLAIFEDYQFLVGNGVGGPQGVLKDATTGGPYTYAYGSVATQVSGGATALTGDAFRQLPYQVPSQYRNAGAKWIMSRGTLRVTKTLKDGTGSYLWGDRNQQLIPGQPPQIEGYGITETETLASPTSTAVTTYTASVYPVLFVTKGSYLIIDKVGMDVTRYDDATTAKQNSIVLVARRRLGGQVLLPWGIATMKVST